MSPGGAAVDAGGDGLQEVAVRRLGRADAGLALLFAPALAGVLLVAAVWALGWDETPRRIALLRAAGASLGGAGLLAGCCAALALVRNRTAWWTAGSVTAGLLVVAAAVSWQQALGVPGEADGALLGGAAIALVLPTSWPLVVAALWALATAWRGTRRPPAVPPRSRLAARS